MATLTLIIDCLPEHVIGDLDELAYVQRLADLLRLRQVVENAEELLTAG